MLNQRNPWFSSDSLIGNLIRLPLRLLPKTSVVRIRGGKTKGKKWIVGSGVHGCWLGNYEIDKQRALERLVKPGMVVYDIGAQAGFFSLLFADLVKDAGKVYAVEPFADNLNYLLAHIRINNLNNVQVLQVALFNRDGLVGFSTEQGVYGNSLVDDNHPTLFASTMSLDRIVALGFSPPDLVKIDVEGAESATLEGATATMKNHRPILFVALHGDEQTQKCGALLRSLTYNIYDLNGTEISANISTDEIYALPKRRLASRIITK